MRRSASRQIVGYLEAHELAYPLYVLQVVALDHNFVSGEQSGLTEGRKRQIEAMRE
jgi:hypothetical protein